MTHIPDFSKKRFTYKGFHGVLNLFSACGPNPLDELKKVFGDSYAFTVYFVHDNYVEWYWHTEDMDRLGQKLVTRSAKDRTFLPKLRVLWQKRCQALDRVFGLVQKTNLKSLSDAKLLALYQKMLTAYLLEYAPSLGLQDAFSMRAEYHVEPVLKGFLSEKGLAARFTEYYPVLFAPVEPSFLSREHQDLLEIAVLIQAAKASHILSQNPASLSHYPVIEKRLKRHAKQYFWVKNNYAKVQELDISYFLAQALLEANPSVTLQNTQSAHKNAKKAKTELFKKIGVSTELKNLVHISELFSFMQDERKGYVLKSNHFQVKILKEVSRRKQIALSDLFYVLPDEVPLALSGRFEMSKAKKRKQFCMHYSHKKGYRLLEGDEAKSIFDTQFSTTSNETGVLTGSCANSGFARGPVKIIRKTHDLANMRQGDVLVASMTRPEMVSAMKKACAIVTDEGGITSHAAVVSRELGIPCLIGTKHATKTFKDGDMVVVDAAAGTVQKI